MKSTVMFVFIAVQALQILAEVPDCRNAEPQIRRYRFVIEYFSTMGPACRGCPGNVTACNNYECITADGVQRAITVVNRQMPGPAIEVCLGDTVEVDVENQLQASDTSIHWHGILQRGTPYMDGATFVTQCPIPQGTTFRYTFKAAELGTYFWHSHHGAQKMDGIVGSLIIRSRDDPSRSLYDTDHHVITLHDWTHELTQAKMPGPIHLGNRGQQANNLLINGRGSYFDSKTGVSNGAPLAEVIVQSNMRHRIRVINMGCFECPMQLQVQGHKLSVIASDGFPVSPVSVDTIILLPGERVDVVLTADQPPAAYWIVVKALADCEDSLIYQRAILVYEGVTSRKPVTPDPGYEAFPHGVVLNPMQAKCGPGDQGICSYQLKSMLARSSIKRTNNMTSLTYAFNFHVYQHSDIFNQPYIIHKPFYIPRDGDDFNYELQAGQINNISMVLPPSPPLSQPHEMTILKSKLACDVNVIEHQNCFHYQQVPLNATLDIFFIHDAEDEEGEAHPMHLHGYKFEVLYQGYNLEDSNNEALFTSSPALKDTVNVPGSGLARIRLRADNPGFWLLHCHIVFHQMTGMTVLLQVGDFNDLPPVPRGFPTCGNFPPPDIL